MRSIPAEGEVQPGLNGPLEFSFTSVGTALPSGSTAGPCDVADQEAAAAGAPEARSRIDSLFPTIAAAGIVATSATCDCTIGAGSTSVRGAACGITTIDGLGHSTAAVEGAAVAGAADGTAVAGSIAGKAAVGDGLAGGAATRDVAAAGAAGPSKKFASCGEASWEGLGSAGGAGAGKFGDAMIVGPLERSICAVFAR